MDLEDQLAALAAGELDDEEARAVRARVAGDPALRAQLVRLERLEAVLTGWEVPPMSDTAAAALDDHVTAALERLDDGPLVADGATVSALRPAPLADRSEDRSVAAAGRRTDPAPGGEVADLGAARARRGVPSWASGLVAAAAAVAVVGTIGVGLSGGIGDSDSATDDAIATGAADAGDEMAEDSAAADTLEERADDEAGDAEGAVPALGPPTAVRDDLDLDAAGLADLAASFAVVADGPQAEGDGAVSDAGRSTGDIAAFFGEPQVRSCVEEVLASIDADQEEVVLVGTGTYEGRDALVVVVRSVRGDPPVVVARVLEPTSCKLIAEHTDDG